MSLAWGLGLAALLGGLLVVERRAFLQAGLSRPLVASALVALCLGQVQSGILVGAPLELFFLGSANLGAALADHETLAACAVSAACAVASQRLGGTSLPAAALAFLLLLPSGRLGRVLDGVENRVHQRFADRALALAQQGQYRAALRMNSRALSFPFVAGIAVVLVGAGVGLGIAAAVPALSPRAARALGVGFLFASAACAAIAVRGARHPRGLLYALASAAAMLAVILLAR